MASLGFSSKESEGENVGVFGGGTLGLSFGATTALVVFFPSPRCSVEGGEVVDDLADAVDAGFLLRVASSSRPFTSTAVCVVVLVVVVLEMTVVVTPLPNAIGVVGKMICFDLISLSKWATNVSPLPVATSRP